MKIFLRIEQKARIGLGVSPLRQLYCHASDAIQPMEPGAKRRPHPLGRGGAGKTCQKVWLPAVDSEAAKG